MIGARGSRVSWGNRGHAGWWAFAVHRASGVALAIFLPVHFLFLAQALNGTAALDAALAWTEQPFVKASEVAIVFLLAVHLAGGLRLLAVEFGGWRGSWQPTAIGVAGAVAAAVALLFALNLG